MAEFSSSGQRPLLPALTGVRFLAALAVVAHHFGNSNNVFIQAGFQHGLIGVSLFFILSGFILSYTYYSTSGAAAIKGSNRAFWTARFSRIYPMYIVGMIMMSPFMFAWNKPEEIWHSGLASITLSQAWLPFSMRTWNPPGWSLSAEAFFYLLFPLIVKTFSTKKQHFLIATLLICWVGSLIAPYIYIRYGVVDRDFWMFNPLARLPEFLIGTIIGLLWVQRRVVTATLPPYSVELAFIILLVIICIPMHEAYVMNGALAPLMTVIILGLATGRGPMARLLSTKLLVALGAASFSLYITHWPLWYLTKSVASRLHLDVNSSPVFWTITAGILVPSSYLCFRFIEEPANKLLRTYFSRLLSPASSSAPASKSLSEPVTRVDNHKHGIM